jgi:hypothetical protein
MIRLQNEGKLTKWRRIIDWEIGELRLLLLMLWMNLVVCFLELARGG